MRLRRPGQGVPSTFYSFQAKPGNNTEGVPRTSPALPKNGTEERSVQRGTHPNQIPPKQENSSHFQRNTASTAGSHSSSKGPPVGVHKCPLGKKINSTQEKPELLHCLLIFQFACKAIGFLTTFSACSSPFSQSPQSLLPPGISLPSSHHFFKVPGLASHSE